MARHIALPTQCAAVFDHTNGNAVFGPDVEIVAHEYAARQLSSGASIRGRAFDWVLNVLEGRIAALQQTIDTTTSAALRDTLQRRLAPNTRVRSAAIEAAVPSRVTRTVSRELVRTRGSRTIRLLHFDPAHTAEDLVVLPPRERLVITGDLMHTNLGSLYLRDAFLARIVELRSHAPQIVGTSAVGADPVAIERLWELLDSKP